jgi:hypothetical protein
LCAAAAEAGHKSRFTHTGQSVGHSAGESYSDCYYCQTTVGSGSICYALLKAQHRPLRLCAQRLVDSLAHKVLLTSHFAHQRFFTASSGCGAHRNSWRRRDRDCSMGGEPPNTSLLGDGAFPLEFDPSVPIGRHRFRLCPPRQPANVPGTYHPIVRSDHCISRLPSTSCG